ncbi:MAG TPA: hypothetical protein PKG52_08585 [bacterium]|nr:hypothetical protein [bacterium]HPS30785.1 hypothetical protein [bacterium]
MKKLIFLLLLTIFCTTGIFADQSKIAIITDFVGDMLPANGSCAGLGMPRGICIQKAGGAFYSIYPDEYDALVFMTTKNLVGTNDPKQAYVTKADIQGINYTSLFGNPGQVGSAGRLMVAAVVGSLASLPDDPLATFTTVPVAGVEVLAHEIAHRWLAYVDIDLGDGSGKSGILRQSANDEPWNHWSSWFNTEGSIQYGGKLTDNGDGSFTDTFGVRKFGPLDQYLMGIRSKEEVGPMFFVKVDYSLLGSPDNPGIPGTTRDYEGERVDFTMDDIIRANGERNPATSPCHLKIAIVLVHPANVPPTQFELDKAESYRVALENWWKVATDGRGSIDTDVNRCGTGTEQCPGIAAAGCEAVNDDDPVYDEDVTSDGNVSGDEDTAVNDSTATDENTETDDFDAVSNDNTVKPDENGEQSDTENKTSSKGSGCSLMII